MSVSPLQSGQYPDAPGDAPDADHAYYDDYVEAWVRVETLYQFGVHITAEEFRLYGHPDRTMALELFQDETSLVYYNGPYANQELVGRANRFTRHDFTPTMRADYEAASRIMFADLPYTTAPKWHGVRRAYFSSPRSFERQAKNIYIDPRFAPPWARNDP